MNSLIETERLLLRELQLDDAPGMFKLDSDPEVHRYLGNKPIHTLAQSIADIEFIRDQYLKNGIGRWAVTLKSTGEFIGWSGLKLITEYINGYNQYYDIGYRFIKSAWGKGYATESAKAALEYGFNTLNADEIFGIADVENLESIHVLSKLGLKKISVFDHYGKLHHWMKIER